MKGPYTFIYSMFTKKANRGAARVRRRYNPDDVNRAS